jgi:hypothetical protein
MTVAARFYPRPLLNPKCLGKLTEKIFSPGRLIV